MAADFYALLKQSIIERGIRDAREREAIYAQARSAVIKQLWDYRPPLAADEIDTRVGSYDAAVERIESDLRAAFADGEIPDRAQPQPAPVRDASRRHSRADEPARPLADRGQQNLAEEAEYDPGVGRAEREERDEYDDAEAGLDERPARQEHARWSDNGEITTTTAAKWWLGFKERDKVQILGGAIVALVVALVGLGAYYLLTRADDGGVTLAIGIRREVSDAATAARIPNDQLDIAQSFSLFSGRDPTIFVTTPDNPVRFDNESGFARVSSSSGAPGVKALIGPGLASRLAGGSVRVTIVARSSKERGAASMRFAYQSGVALSHWQTANLDPEYETVGMVWRLPAMRTNPAGDYLLIEPGIPGDGTGVDIQSIKIDLLAGESS